MKCLLILLPLLVLSTADNNRPTRRENIGQLKSYCESETFKARCWTDHVIVMQTAVYGRMRIGRCVEADLGHLGCQKDVLRIADAKCSALQECEIRIPDGDLDAAKPCFKELKVYLEANYSCLRVLSEDQTCSVSATVSPSHISNLIINRHDCGSESQPWSIQADPGQHISVSLTDFSFSDDSESKQGPGLCRPYGYVFDGRAGRNTTICGVQKRTNFVYESKSNALEIVLFKRKMQQDSEKFIVQFQAVGCADLRPLRDAWILRTKNEVIVGCNLTSQTWHLTCRGHQWVGVIGNCTQRLLVAQTEARVGMPLANLSSDILIIVVVAISLTLCLIIIFAGVAYVRSWSGHNAGLSSTAIDYTSVVASDYKCEHSIGGDRGCLRKTSYPPSVMSFDYTEMLQPVVTTPGHRGNSDVPVFPSINVMTSALQGSEVQFVDVQRQDCKTDGFMSKFSENL